MKLYTIISFFVVYQLTTGCVDRYKHQPAEFDKNRTLTKTGEVAQIISNTAITDHYASACANYGVLRFAELTNNITLKNAIIENYKTFISNKKIYPGHVDNNVFGILPFEIYIQTKDVECFNFAKQLSDDEWANPRNDGLTEYTRFWTDDMFMVAALQVQAYRATNDVNYIDRAILQLLAYAQRLQQQNGLFQHTINTPVFWGRANGWAAVAMSMTLENLPKDSSKYQNLLAAYKKMMTALLKYQDATGLWHQVIIDPQSFQETSCTAMFIYALATGIKNGWLDESFMPSTMKGFNALLDHVENGKLSDVCVGTNESARYDDYLNRPREKGDFHGQAPFIWAATAILELENSRSSH
jgi:unsaturated rhamnogalacturonyl hydrolase